MKENQMSIIQKYASASIRWSQTPLITGERLAESISNSSVGSVFQSLQVFAPFLAHRSSGRSSALGSACCESFSYLEFPCHFHQLFRKLSEILFPSIFTLKIIIMKQALRKLPFLVKMFIAC